MCTSWNVQPKVFNFAFCHAVNFLHPELFLFLYHAYFEVFFFSKYFLFSFSICWKVSNFPRVHRKCLSTSTPATPKHCAHVTPIWIIFYTIVQTKNFQQCYKFYPCHLWLVLTNVLTSIWQLPMASLSNGQSNCDNLTLYSIISVYWNFLMFDCLTTKVSMENNF